MPTYEYECKTCTGTFEVVQSIKAAPLKSSACPHCRKTRPVRRLISGGGALLFRGSGFYLTDYRSDSYKKAADAEKPSAKADDSRKSDAPKADAAKAADTKSSETSKPAAAEPAPKKKKPRNT